MNTTLRTVLVIVVALLVLGAIYFAMTSKRVSDQPSDTDTNAANESVVNDEEGNDEFIEEETTTTEETAIVTFSDPKKTPHYESNTSEHSAILAGVPVNVVIDFNFDLSTKSSMTITKDGKDYGSGAATVDANKLVLRRAMDPNAPDGTYTVAYNACWPDNTCHDGKFQFAIDRTEAENYEDLRAQNAVTITIADLSFSTDTIRIKQGTAVTWVNDDEVGHYINTDTHPAHTYQADMNSKFLQTGDRYSYTFTKPGIYPYHCSAHAEIMAGAILVE